MRVGGQAGASRVGRVVVAVLAALGSLTMGVTAAGAVGESGLCGLLAPPPTGFVGAVSDPLAGAHTVRDVARAWDLDITGHENDDDLDLPACGATWADSSGHVVMLVLLEANSADDALGITNEADAGFREGGARRLDLGVEHVVASVAQQGGVFAHFAVWHHGQYVAMLIGASNDRASGEKAARSVVVGERDLLASTPGIGSASSPDRSVAFVIGRAIGRMLPIVALVVAVVLVVRRRSACAAARDARRSSTWEELAATMPPPPPPPATTAAWPPPPPPNGPPIG